MLDAGPSGLRANLYSMAHRTVPPSQNNGRRRLRFCNSPVQVTPHSRSLTRWDRDPRAPPVIHWHRAPPRARQVNPHVSESEMTATQQSKQATNGHGPAARRRRPVPATASSPAAAALAARACLLRPRPRPSKANLLPVTRSPTRRSLHPDYKWSSAQARPAALRPPLPAAARCHPHASSPVS
jgi:hypothetical protein